MLENKAIIYVPISVDTALDIVLSGGSVYVKSNFESGEHWVEFNGEETGSLFEEVADKCGVRFNNEIKTAFHIRNEINL